MPKDHGPPPQHLVDFVRGLAPCDRALDIGCGDGRLTGELRCARVSAADVSAVALERARRRLPEADVVQLHPDEPRLYRHRGHRYITLRKFDLAIRDLRKAADLIEGKPDQAEPDGQPNARNVPTSTLDSNIYYHLGLAYYLKGEFADAANAYRKCLEFSTSPDMLVATTTWLYMALQRLGLKDDAERALNPIRPDMDVIENQAYYRLLMSYKGLASPATSTSATGVDAVTVGYARANASITGGRIEEGVKQLKSLMDKHADQWPAFGFIAAEADVVRLDKPKKKQSRKD